MISLGVRDEVGSNSIKVACPSVRMKLLRIGSDTSFTASAFSAIPVRVGRDKTSCALGSLWKLVVNRLTAAQPAGESGEPAAAIPGSRGETARYRSAPCVAACAALAPI